jgi:hypothetical protein
VKVLLTALVLFVLYLSVAARAHASQRQQAQEAIRYVFGPYGDQAVRVADCETGGTFSIWARNGQYLGLFQMGSYARARYGHAWNAWAEAVSAYRYFIDSGRDWSPWTCKP